MEIFTDEKGEYILNSYGSKLRRAGESAWVGYADEMSQAEIDAKATEAARAAVERDKQAAIQTILREHLKLTYNLCKFADPASTAAQKTAASTYIHEKRVWIEDNVAKLQDLLS